MGGGLSGPPQAARAAAESAPPAGRPGPRWWRELALVAGFYAVYDGIRGLIAGHTAQAQHDGRDLLHWEQLVHLDPEHALNAGLQHLVWLAVPACFFYAALHFLVTPGVLVFTYRWRRNEYRRARTVLAGLTAAALIGFWRFPTAPPRLLAGAGFHDTLAAFSGWGWWGSTGDAPAGAAGAVANQFAAMPSLHVAWALWCAATIAGTARHRWVRLAAWCYPAATALVVLATANHYLLDVLAGALLWLAATGVVRYLNTLGLAQ